MKRRERKMKKKVEEKYGTSVEMVPGVGDREDDSIWYGKHTEDMIKKSVENYKKKIKE